MTLELLQQRLGVTFADPELPAQALRHPSAGEPSYQRLEFLGDRVLGLAVGEWLCERFPQADEGELTRRLTSMVRESALAGIGRDWGLADVIQLGIGEHGKESILADVVEALLGAVWLAHGMDAVRGVIRRAWAPLIDLQDEKDAKTQLQEWLQQRGLPVPVYEVLEESGPAHDRFFRLRVESTCGSAEGEGRSKQQAGTAAAAALMKKLRESEK